VLIAELSSLDAVTLRREIEAVFDGRRAQAPHFLPLPPPDWALPFRRLAEEVGISADLGAGHQDAAAMLDPILKGNVADGEWIPAAPAWVQGGQKSR
jgi:hypothetical protein